eukprot:547592-Amphidinium_carterae.1
MFRTNDERIECIAKHALAVGGIRKSTNLMKVDLARLCQRQRQEEMYHELWSHSFLAKWRWA